MVEIFVSTSQGSKEKRARIPKRGGHAEVEEAKRSEKSRADHLRSNLTFRNQRKSEVVLWIFRVRFVYVCVCVGHYATRIRERNRSQRAKRLPGSEEIRWLKLRLVSIFFSPSLSLFPFFISSYFPPPSPSFLAGRDPLWTFRGDGWKSRKKQNVGGNGGGRTISKGSKEVFPVVK